MRVEMRKTDGGDAETMEALVKKCELSHCLHDRFTTSLGILRVKCLP